MPADDRSAADAARCSDGEPFLAVFVGDVEYVPARRVARFLDGLLDVYTRDGVGVWLTGAHRLLSGRRPIDVLADTGGIDRLEQLLDQLRTGAYV